LTTDEAEAEILIVNTCGFIESAKKESIETILELAEYKNKKCKMLIATGCLVQRYTNELSKELVEVNAFLGTCNYENINNVIYSFFSDNNRVVLYNTINKRLFTKNRVLSTPNHFAYLKIAEGCDNKCTYCAIPKIRGNYTSRKAEELMEEAEFLVEEYGITELNIVAQDITRYGIDLYGEYKLVQLLNNLSTLDIKWIRLLYCYPELLSDELINLIATNDKICKYIDIPLQHVSDKILKLMNRRTTYQQIVGLITKIRKANPNICIRSTFIVGFPGETEQDFNELCNFIKEYKLDKCGFFAYSKEDGTPAEKLPNQIENNVKEQRKAILYALQYDIMLQKAKDSIGKIVPVIYENIDYEKQLFVGRTMFDAPIIDTNIYFTASFPLEIGKIYNVKITNNNDIDLIGEANEFTN
ncbi:MAG: 30S ribosomal protein S12 methylthiotransferase RimO, partial [Clostridia bacterium]